MSEAFAADHYIFLFLAISDDIGYRAHGQLVREAKVLEIGGTGHGAVGVENLANDSGSAETDHSGEIYRSLGMTGSFQDATLSGS